MARAPESRQALVALEPSLPVEPAPAKVLPQPSAVLPGAESGQKQKQHRTIEEPKGGKSTPATYTNEILAPRQNGLGLLLGSEVTLAGPDL
jgi:hypothetical protein